MIGEWLALPIMQAAGSKAVGDAVYEEFLYPVASRLLERCDAALRIPGESKGAVQDARIARQLGLQVFHRLKNVPRAP